MESFICKVGVAYINECVSRNSNEILTGPIDKWLLLISNLKQLYHNETEQ